MAGSSRPASDIKTSDVVIAWVDAADGQITVKNDTSGSTSIVTGTKADSPQGTSWRMSGLYAKLPASLIVLDAQNKLNLSFQGLTADNPGGVALVVPYVDEAMPLGRLYLKFPFDDLYGGAGPSTTFSLVGMNESDKSSIRPVLMLFDGQTKSGSLRPNFLNISTGLSGSEAGDMVFQYRDICRPRWRIIQAFRPPGIRITDDPVLALTLLRQRETMPEERTGT